MKKDRSFNSYFWNNISESRNLIAFAQTVDKQGVEDQVIRIVSKEVIGKVTEGSPKSSNSDKEFLAYDAVTSNDKSITLPSITRLTVQCLRLVPIQMKGNIEEVLFVGTSSGVFIYHSNFSQQVSLYDKFGQYVFTSITDNASNVYVSHYNGQIDKIVFVVSFYSTGHFHQISFDGPQDSGNMPWGSQRVHFCRYL
jgi:hypothetical protein